MFYASLSGSEVTPFFCSSHKNEHSIPLFCKEENKTPEDCLGECDSLLQEGWRILWASFLNHKRCFIHNFNFRLKWSVRRTELEAKSPEFPHQVKEYCQCFAVIHDSHNHLHSWIPIWMLMGKLGQNCVVSANEQCFSCKLNSKVFPVLN